MSRIMRHLKTATIAGLVFLVILSVLWVLIFSSPFLMDKYVGHLSRHSGPDTEFRYKIYTKSEFAKERFNITLAPDNDFIALFEAHLGSTGKKETPLIIFYDIESERDPCVRDIYGINKYRDLVYTTERRVCGFKR